MPEKGEQCPLGAYKGSLAARYRIAGELLSLPAQARSILRGIDDVDHPLVANAFDCGARLYQVAAVCGRFFPSVGLAYRVAAVEAVCHGTRAAGIDPDVIAEDLITGGIRENNAGGAVG